MKRSLVFTCLAICLASALFTYRVRAREAQTPIRDSSFGLPPINANGEVDQAMVQLGVLMEYLKTHNWIFPMREPEFSRIRRLLFLPGREHTENWDDRGPDNPNVCITSMTSGIRITQIYPHEYDQIAFYTTIFARKNLKVYKNMSSKLSPTGFWIVGYKDGSIKQIPVGEIRVIRDKEKHTHHLSMPGCQSYPDGYPYETYLQPDP